MHGKASELLFHVLLISIAFIHSGTRVVAGYGTSTASFEDEPEGVDINYSGALNYGVEKANRDTILVLSSHCQIDTIGPYGFGKIEELLNDQGYVAVFGDQTPIWRGKKISKNYVWSHFGTEDQQNMWSKIENRFFLHNDFCFYSKPFCPIHEINIKYQIKVYDHEMI